MGDILTGVLVAGILLTYALMRRRPDPRDEIVKEERRAIEKQGEILAKQDALRKPHTPQEAADAINEIFDRR